MQRSLIALAALGGLLAAVVVVVAIVPPTWFTRWAVVSSSEWLMADAPASGLKQKWRRTVSSYLQYALAAEIADRLQLDRVSDERAIYDIMMYVRGRSLSPEQIQHLPVDTPMLIRGIGFCDQTNAVVATIASRRFARAEIFALRKGSSSPHTIGRVWSDHYGEWLYFDAFYSKMVIFTKGPTGKPRFLRHPDRQMASRGFIMTEIYDLPGSTLAVFPPTFVGFVRERASWQQAGIAPPAPADPASKAPAPPPPSLRDESVYRGIAAGFVAARVADLLGEDSAPAYRRVAGNPLAVRDERAAAIASLANRLALVAHEVQ